MVHLVHHSRAGDLPTLTDHPEIFGEHANADVACSIQNANRMFDALKSMQATTGEQDTDPAHQNVHDCWQSVYPSDRPLGSWMRDLISRVEQFSKWLSRARPPTTFCLGAFTLPLSFLMAVQQTAARHYQLSIESVSWHFSVLSPSDSITPVSAEVQAHPSYISINKHT